MKKLIVLSLIATLWGATVSMKIEAPKKHEHEKPYMIVGQMPRFPGGKPAMQRFIRDSLSYPFEALKHNIQGKVNVEFVVGKDGTLTDIRTMGQKLGYGLEEQAIKLFTKMPKWSPGKQDGIVVPVYMMIPILFTI